MVIRKEDLADLDVVDAVELASDGYTIYLTTTLISTATSGSIVTINLPSDGEGLITGRDHLAQSGDRVQLIGTSGGSSDGYFIINSVLTETTFSVTSFINNSTGGTIYFMYPSGAYSVGFDPSGLSLITSHNIQDAIREVALNAAGISETTHKTLRHLIHFIDSGGPADGFISGAYKETLPAANPFPTNIIWWESSLKTKKIVEKTLVLNGSKNPIQIQWNMYDNDGITIIATIIDTITYSGIFEISRTRSFF